MKQTNYATLFEEKVKEEIHQEEKQILEEEKQAEQEEIHGRKEEHKKTKEKQPRKVNASKIRKKHLDELHKLMDDQIEKRDWRFQLAVFQSNTTRQWQLIAAAVEEANIIFHKLTGRDATKMRGRSKVSFKSKNKDALKGLERNEDLEEEVEIAKWMQRQAGEHAKLGNKLVNTARRMKANADADKSKKTKEENEEINKKTLEAYAKLANKLAKGRELNEKQKQCIKEQWNNFKQKQEKQKQKGNESKIAQEAEDFINLKQQAGQEFHEMAEQVSMCEASNSIHAAKLERIGHLHNDKATKTKTANITRNKASPKGNQFQWKQRDQDHGSQDQRSKSTTLNLRRKGQAN
jgi:hypothetical protein